MSKKSAAVGTGAIAFRPLVDIVVDEEKKKIIRIPTISKTLMTKFGNTPSARESHSNTPPFRRPISMPQASAAAKEPGPK
jgi:hypothetical protein